MAQVVAGTDIVAGQHVIAGQAAQQDVLGAPAADAGQAEEDLTGAVIAGAAERLQVQLPGRRLAAMPVMVRAFALLNPSARSSAGSAAASPPGTGNLFWFPGPVRVRRARSGGPAG